MRYLNINFLSVWGAVNSMCVGLELELEFILHNKKSVHASNPVSFRLHTFGVDLISWQNRKNEPIIDSKLRNKSSHHGFCICDMLLHELSISLTQATTLAPGIHHWRQFAADPKSGTAGNGHSLHGDGSDALSATNPHPYGRLPCIGEASRQASRSRHSN